MGSSSVVTESGLNWSAEGRVETERQKGGCRRSKVEDHGSKIAQKEVNFEQFPRGIT